jgi:protein lysine acetyltransferase
MGLADLDLFADVPPGEVAALELSLEPVRVDAGTVVMRQGEAGSSFLLIVEGQATVSRDGADVGTVGPGSIVGELALLHAGPRTATVTAATPLVGLAGGATAFAALAEITGVRERFGRTAAQRLVASVRPVHHRLADGTALEIRPVLPADRARLETALDRHFSQESHRKRFFSPGKVSPTLLSYLVDVDYVNHFAWVVMTMEEGALRGVASTRYIRLHDDPETAEVAFGVTDDYQGRGIGHLLLGALAAAAPVGGVRNFRASVLAENTPMRSLLDRFGARWQFEEPGVVATTIPVENVVGLVDERLAAALHAAARDIVTTASLALA